MCGIWGSYFNIPKTIFYLLKGDYISALQGKKCDVSETCLDWKFSEDR